MVDRLAEIKNTIFSTGTENYLIGKEQFNWMVDELIRLKVENKQQKEEIEVIYSNYETDSKYDK